MLNKKQDYVLRISIPYCNLRCLYCRREFYKVAKSKLLSDKELLEVIKAASKNGISRIRWTGGEPTLKPNFLNMVKEAKSIGIQEQYLSTNGTVLYAITKKLKKAGINRVNISLDTLDRKKFRELTGSDLLPDVIKSINVAIKTFKKTKINTVLTKNSYINSNQLINFIAKITRDNKVDTRKICIRFIELIYGGFKGDKEYVTKNYILGDKLLRKIKQEFGEIRSINFEGDNPMCKYYQIKRNKVIFGIIPHYSVNFRCGGKNCKKLRLSPTGILSNCSIYKKFGHDLRNTPYDKKLKVMNHLVNEKMNRTKKDFSRLRHYQTDYSFWRFGVHSRK